MTEEVDELPPEVARALASLGGRKLAIVEGETDRDILYNWYIERAAEIVFHPVGGNIRVTELTSRIRKKRSDVSAFGIRDRDFLSGEEVAASLADPNGFLFIWNRYCLENYLIEPDALLPEMEAFLGASCPIADVGTMAAEILAMCRNLHTMMAANWILIENGSTRYSDGHHILPRADFVNNIAEELRIDESTADNLLTSREQLLAPYLTSLETAHHCTSGKHLLHQIYRFMTQKQRGLVKDHLVRLLRNRIKDSVGIHPDIHAIVEERILAST